MSTPYSDKYRPNLNINVWCVAERSKQGKLCFGPRVFNTPFYNNQYLADFITFFLTCLLTLIKHPAMRKIRRDRRNEGHTGRSAYDNSRWPLGQRYKWSQVLTGIIKNHENVFALYDVICFSANQHRESKQSRYFGWNMSWKTVCVYSHLRDVLLEE